MTSAHAWVSPALLALTVRVWSKRYGRPIDDTEAMDILLCVGRLMDVLRSPLSARARAETLSRNLP
ncbi:MAG TPA: hypothetical protein VGN12_19460 [Pirellulales bacterium]|jgi:hypothetical protein